MHKQHPPPCEVCSFSPLLFSATISLSFAQTTPALSEIRHRLTDCHLHLVDFLQHTDGGKALIDAMDKAGVDDAMLCGMPLVKQGARAEDGQPQYYLDDDARCYWYSATDVLVQREVSALPPESRKRFHPFICGINSAD